MSLHFQTPIYPSAPLSQATGRKVLIKLDALQPTGSFKIRGVGHACMHHAARGVSRFVSSSGGNAGIAVAYAARSLGIAADVFVPVTTSKRAIDILNGLGARVVIHGASWQEANERATSGLSAADAFIHPFDDPLLWEGHASIIDEIVAEGHKPDLIVLSVGGGGLLSGVVAGLRRHGLSTPVLAVETSGTASLAQSAQAHRRITLPAISGVATSLGARQVAEHAYDLLQSHPISCTVVSDWQAVDGCLRFMADHRILVEPACGAALAAVYGNTAGLKNARSVAVIVCGGATAEYDQLTSWSRELPPINDTQVFDPTV